MKRLMIALSAAAVLIAAAPAWAHDKGRGHSGHYFKPQHHSGYVHRPHFRQHFGRHHTVSRFHAPVHRPRIVIGHGFGWHASPHHNHGVRHGHWDGHRRSWR